jgi:CelD/BcsL family acetyltransferase involved in cellulose biosynthesis
MTPHDTAALADPSAADKQMSVRVLDSFADAEPFRSSWNELVLRSGVDIYQTYDWCRIWWQYYGERRQLHLLLYFSGEELMGLIPAFIETLWLGPARLRVAKLVGADFTLQLCNLPVVSDALTIVVSRTVRYFLGEHGCDLLLFGPLSGRGARSDKILSVGRHERDIVARAESLGNSCNTFFHLPESFNEYLKALDRKPRSNFNRQSTQISKAYRVTCDVVCDETEVSAAFEEFCMLHDAQWRVVGKLGHFGDWPHAREFNRDMVRSLGGQGLVRFYRIFADDQVVSSQFVIVFGGTAYWRLPARVCGPQWDRFGLGAIGLVEQIRAGISERIKTLEGGRGHYAYKLQYGGCELPLRTLQFVRRGSGVLTRVRLFGALAYLFNMAYYKVVFARLAPRLRALRRPLMPVWIRSTW